MSRNLHEILLGGSLLHEIRTGDTQRAQRIAQMKAENEQASRDRKWSLRQLGVAP